MKTAVIANPRASNGAVGRNWAKHNRVVVECFGVSDVRMSQGPRDATRLVRESLAEGYERIVVVGGDGTVNEAVNGFFADDGTAIAPDVPLAYLPAGTGGDFARSIGLSGVDLRRALAAATARAIDVGRATLTAHDGSEITRYFVNISSFGSSGLIVDKVNRTTKMLGGKASFAIGAVKGLITYRNKRVRLTVDDLLDEEMRINTVAVANGRFFGGSMKVAPRAIVDDGELDVITIGDLTPYESITQLPKIYAGTHIASPKVRELRGKVITATPVDSDVLIDLDGEQPGKLPVRYEVMPKALQLLAPWESAVAALR